MLKLNILYCSGCVVPEGIAGAPYYCSTHVPVVQELCASRGGGVYSLDHEYNQSPAPSTPQAEPSFQQGGLCGFYGSSDQNIIFPRLHY